MPSTPSRTLETVENPRRGRPYRISISAPEFTCLCPRTGQPDFATIKIDYLPDALLIELKSLKLYLWSWRDEGTFHEAVVNQILDDLTAAAAPVWIRVVGEFKVRGGITTSVTADSGRPPADLPQAPRTDEESL